MIGTISIEDVVKGVVVNGENVVDYDGIAKIIIPDPPEVPVKDVKVDGESVVNAQGVADITIPDPPEAPVKDVKVNGESVVNAQGVADVDVPVISNLRVVKQLPGVPAAVATVSDAEAFTMPSLKVAIEPQQEGSGDPSPTNVRPISGWDRVNVYVSGKNLFDISQLVVGGIANDGSNVSNTDFRRSPYIFVKKGTYEISRLIHSQWWKLYYYKNDENKTPIAFGVNNQTDASNTITFTEDVYVRLGFDYIPTEADEIMFTLGSKSTYATYDANSTTYTIDLDGTRYGGKLNVVSGVLTDIIKVFEVDEARDIEMLTSHIFRINKSKYPDGKFDGNSIEGLLCEKFKPQISDMPNNICYSTTNGLIIRTIDAYANTSEFLNTIGSFKFTYPLATPLTIQLTPTAVKSLEGVNNIFADSGDVLQGEYASNIKVVDIG